MLAQVYLRPFNYLHNYSTNTFRLAVLLRCLSVSDCPQVDCVVTTAGGVEEDLIKCLAPTYVGSFELAGASLRKQGINRSVGRQGGAVMVRTSAPWFRNAVKFDSRCDEM